MKRPNFTQFNFLNKISEYFKANTRAFSIVLTLTFIYTNTYSQYDCNSILACNDGVQISLDDDCDLYIEPDMILEDPAYGDVAYDISAKLPNGTSMTQVTVGLDPLGRPVRRVAINRTHIGMALEVKVSLRGCGNSCWGTANIEDKLAPVITSCPCEPRITTFTGSVDAAVDGSYDRPSVVSGCPGAPTAGVIYDARNFALDADGIVDISLPATSVRFSLYVNSFNPVSPCTNLLATNATSFHGPLNDGVNYVLVVSSIGTGTPPGGIGYTVHLDTDTGNIKSSVAATVCVRTCLNEASLLAQTVANASTPPVFTDGCAGSLTLTKRDEIEVLGCQGQYSKVIKRIWSAKDASGNTSADKIQYFYIERLTLADAQCPADWIKECGTSYVALPNGAPSPVTSGMPMIIGCQNIQVYYEDVVFDLCGPGIKVFRQWTIIDWCSGEEKVCGQTIKIEDTFAPLIDVPQPFSSPICFYGAGESGPLGSPKPSAAIIGTQANACIAKPWTITTPSLLTDACSAASKLTWYVKFKTGDGSCFDPDEVLPFVTTNGTASVLGTPGTANYRIEGLPLGRTWVRYYASDECGNERTVTVEVDVVDTTPPTAICEDQSVISIDDSGWGELLAFSLDNHSNDNCGEIAKYEVKRKTTTCPGYASDLNFGPKVRFCCSDITSPSSYVTVVLRVYDAAGNYNECETEVKVQNKRPPYITCPSNKTLTCGDSKIAAWISGTATFDTTFFGKPTTGGVCGSQRFASRIVDNNISAKCNTGTVDREWYLVSDPTVKCTQRLTITSPAFTEANVTFPGERIIPSCNLDDATPDALNSRPIVSNLSCRDIGVTYTDQVFTVSTEACIKILRTWKVIDWCSYPTNPVVAEKLQVIKLMGTGGAVFTGCTAKNFDTDAGSCDKEVTLSASATDACTAPEDLIYTWSLDLGKNGTNDLSGLGKSFTRVLPIGTHKVTFTVTNRCGTPTTCMYDVTIKGTKKPTPVCIREVVWVMGSNGSTEVWASDFNLKSENNCGEEGKLKFSFNEAGTQPARTFTCADLPNGQIARIPLRMYVIDENGNFDFCEVTLILQDSPLTNACQDVASLLPSVSGRITTEMSDGVNNIEVELTNMTSALNKTEMTNNEGQYKFDGIDVFDPKTIEARNEADLLNGVSTLDLVMMQRHILGLQSIASPYKLLAADVNNSKSITASDLVDLRKVILGMSTSFVNNTSWRFVPSDFVFQDPTYPFDFPSMINLDSLFEDKTNVNFIGVKVGDVNNSVEANLNSSSTENRSANALFVTDLIEFEGGAHVKVDVKAAELMDIMGTQFGLGFDADQLVFQQVKSGKLNVHDYNINTNLAADGKLYFSIDIPNGVSLSPDDVLMTIEFKSKAKGNTAFMSTSNDNFDSEVYELDGTVKSLNILARSNASGPQNELFQNQPNPFKDFTNISFELAEAANTSIKVMDVTGKVVYTHVSNYEKGYHTLTLSNAHFTGKGVYYYQINAGEFTATKKMILIE